MTAPATPLAPPLTPLPKGPFDLILADPAWAFRTFNGRNRTPTQKAFPSASSSEAVGDEYAEDHYPTMTLAEMKAIPVGDVAAKNSLLAMWIVGSHCDAALELAQAWGFRFVTDLFYWMKQKLRHADQIDLFTGDIQPLPMSMGYHTRKQIEPCWLFARGKGLPVLNHDVRQLIVAPKTGHSRKPAEQYTRLERLYGTPDPTGENGPRTIELFARNTRAGWSSWGNEVGKFDREKEAAA